jgi:hypothetical protein
MRSILVTSEDALSDARLQAGLGHDIRRNAEQHFVVGLCGSPPAPVRGLRRLAVLEKPMVVFG